MSARPPARAPTDKYSLTSAKKSGVADAIPTTAKARAMIDPTRLPCNNVVTKRPTAAIATQVANCQPGKDSTARLVSDLLEKIASDGLYKAVLDEEAA
jgi:hypothetical protein